MKKILIFGNSGSGKSTLAKELAKNEGLGHLDLDILAWLQTSPPQRAPIRESKKKIDEFVSINNSWVIEGCYADLLELLRDLTSELIFLNLNIDQCIENAKRRPWEPHKYPTKEAQDANLNMLIDWIKDYYVRDDEFSHSAHLRFFEKFDGKKTMFVSNQRSA